MSYRLILKGYWRSSATWRVRIALHLKELDFTYVPIHLVRNGGEQHLDSFKQQNPLAQVPVLEVYPDEKSDQRLTPHSRPDTLDSSSPYVLTQSMAMVDWLDALKPSPRLFPIDPWQRAQVIQRAEVINSGTQPLQNLAVLQWVEQRYQGNKLEWGKRYIEKGLNALEHLCKHEHTPFLVGDQPSMADLCLIPQLYNARRFKLDLKAFPRLCEIESNCQTLDAFYKAHPDQQTDANL